MDDVTPQPLVLALPVEIAQIVQPVNVAFLESYEDHISAAVDQINKRDSAAWGLADIFLSLVLKFGETSQIEFASQLGIPRSTITNYIRTVRAFPPAQRLPEISFTHHMEASYSDSYDEKEKAFTSENRFNWIQTAADEKLRTRHLAAKIKQEKQKKEMQTEYLPCYLCNVGDIDVLEFVILIRDPHSGRHTSKQMMLHEKCFGRIELMIEEKRAIA